MQKICFHVKTNKEMDKRERLKKRINDEVLPIIIVIGMLIIIGFVFARL